ncbi:MAG: DHH family phosphoesterase [Clostridiales bacterium]|nr:DHH family phosphoesterase [Clostridiales bacterium]
MDKDSRAKSRLYVYQAWPLILSVPVLCGNLAVAVASKRIALMISPFTLIYIVLAVWLYVSHRKRLLSTLTRYSSEHSWVQKHLITKMELPYALSDEKGWLLWYNQSFRRILNAEKVKKKNLLSLFPEITNADLEMKDESAEVHAVLGKTRFRIHLQRISMKLQGEEKDSLVGDCQEIFAVYLQDETEILAVRQEIEDEKPVVGMIYLDNYEEALESVEEVHRSLLMALIDRKINKYIGSMEGIVKKLEKDKYLFILNQKYMNQILEERFSILEDVKSVNIGNEMAVTLSIGVGMDGGSYNKDYEYARAAIDMALGRGGDQAVVKAGSKIQYYGGKSQQQEKTTRVKARVKAHALRELMETKDRVLIMGHRLGDIDSFGSSVGIYRIAVSLNKKAHIVINELTTSVQPMLERFRSSVDYPDDMILNGAQAAEQVDSNTLLVVVDVNRPSITDAPELLRMVKTIVVLDHHRQSGEVITNAVLSYVEPYASSASEMVTEILQYIADDIKIRPIEADAMYAGIVVDTNNFQNQPGVRTFEAAAYLRRCGADVTRVRKMFCDSLAENKARAAAVLSAELYRGYVAIGELPAEGLQSPTVVGAQAANELLNIKGIKASVVMTVYHNTVFLSARSIDEVNVQVMMEMLGGGGHRTVAGAQLAGATITEAKRRVKEVIDQMLQKGEI